MTDKKKKKKKKKKNIIDSTVKLVNKVKNSSTVKSIQGFEKNITKKHKIINRKKLSISGQVKLPSVNAKWNSGKPTVKIKNAANFSAKYKVNKNIALNASVNYATKSKPQYKVGINIKLGNRKKG